MNLFMETNSLPIFIVMYCVMMICRYRCSSSVGSCKKNICGNDDDIIINLDVDDIPGTADFYSGLSTALDTFVLGMDKLLQY